MYPTENLLERATPELLRAIAQYREVHPTIAGNVERTLTENMFVSDVPFGTMVDINSICYHAKVNFNFNNPWTLFNRFKEVVSEKEPS